MTFSLRDRVGVTSDVETWLRDELGIPDATVKILEGLPVGRQSGRVYVTMEDVVFDKMKWVLTQCQTVIDMLRRYVR